MSGWNSCLEPLGIHVNCFHFRAAVFVHVVPAQLCTGNGAVEVAWIAQNIRHSSASV